MREQNENKVSGNMVFVVNEALREALLSINSVEDLKVLDNYNFSGSVDAYGTAFCVEHSFNPVSYTHLDVYKRQGQQTGKIGNLSSGNPLQREENEMA